MPSPVREMQTEMDTAPNRGGVCNLLLLLVARLWRQTARSVRVAAACCRGVSVGGVCRCLCGLHRRASTPRHPLSTSMQVYCANIVWSEHMHALTEESRAMPITAVAGGGRLL